jgi:hypothetical protein
MNICFESLDPYENLSDMILEEQNHVPSDNL